MICFMGYIAIFIASFGAVGRPNEGVATINGFQSTQKWVEGVLAYA